MKINSLFTEQDRENRLNEKANPLEEFKTLIDWEIYRDELESMFAYKNGKGGRPAYDAVMMFKILFLQRLYNLSDDEMEFHLLDRRSFQKFLEIEKSDKIPDAKTIWVFRERLKEENLEKVLFEKLNYWLKRSGKIVRSGSIIDASFVEVPIQRNTKEENETIKEGKVPQDWEEDIDKKSQKDVDAKWTKKNNKSYFGYKHHVVVDAKSKIIEDYEVTVASVHDSVTAPELLERLKEGSEVSADSAYNSDNIKDVIKEKKLDAKICKKGARNHPLGEEDKNYNKEVSRIRARVEHVFGDIEKFGGDFIRTIGKRRAEVQIFLTTFVYNLRRYKFLAGA
ncbi:IS5 family transposase [Candidatus Nomurabacteria bacterium]|nr:IS5 family transposase [Candidatus Nomurabacteria bacterium]